MRLPAHRRHLPRPLLTGVIALLAATTLMPLSSAPASAARPIAAAAAAAAVPTDYRLASDDEKANAAAVLGIVADASWMVYNDRDFVAAIILAAPDSLPEVQAAGRIAWFSEDPETVLAYIQYEIYEAKSRDDARSSAMPKPSARSAICAGPLPPLSASSSTSAC